MKTRLETRRRPGRGWSAARFRTLELLEVRALLSAASADVLLIQVVSDQGARASLLPIAATDGVAVQPTGLPGVYQATGDPGTLATLSGELAGRPGIAGVEPEATLHIDATPNDPQFLNGTLWGLNGTKGINTPAAWDVSTGSTKIVVADIDTGMDYNHPDLYENVWLNQKEIPPTRLANLKDTDGDGLITFRDLNDPVNQGPGKITDVNGDGRIDASDVLAPMQKDAHGNDTGLGGWADGISEDGDTTHLDDLVGWNFVTNTNNPFDDNGHGTHTAGTVGAMGNNGVGVVGVNWSVEIMPLKFLDASGSGTDVNGALAVRYAADHGARVSNNSYAGGDGAQFFSDAITYAASKNSIFVAAAGNSSSNNDVTPNYPSNYSNDNIIAVAAIAQDGTLAGFSSYGATTVDIAAPGVNVLSTTPSNSYSFGSGTSMATPHVTGTVALLESLHPDWSYQQVISRILSSATPSANLAGKTVTGGVLNAAAALGVGSGATATFVGTDATTQGSWKGTYGTDGSDVIGDTAALPSYATVVPAGQPTYVWAGSTSDPRALQKPAAGSADRVAATWYDASQFSVDVHFAGTTPKMLTLYAVDWDSWNGGRSERIDLVDDASGKVLDSRSISGFNSGVYLSWDVTGNVTVEVTNLNPGSNAVLSGLFFGGNWTPPPPPAVSSGSATFVGTDATTQGTWKGTYGADGSDVIGDTAALPPYATVAPSGQSTYVWAGSTSDPRALVRPAAGSADRVAATWYAASQFSVDVHLAGATPRMLTIYALDWDNWNGGRSERIDLVDDASGKVLDSRSISAFGGGVYLSWMIGGDVTVMVTNLNPGSNAVLSGLFFGGDWTPPPPPPVTSGTAAFIGSDAATEGNWKGTYGADGSDVVADAAALPAYATVSPSGQGTYVWAASTTDPRALQKPAAGSADRLAATWYAASQFSVDVAVTDGKAHRLSLYAVDWDSWNGGRSERIDLIDPATNTVLDTETLSAFQNGTYLSWTITGHVIVRVTNLSPASNAVLSGIFLG